MKCFEDSDSPLFVVIMYINGQGTPRDLDKAQEALNTRKKTYPEQYPAEQVAPLQKAIDECRSAPKKPCPRVDFCRDVAYTTPDSEICEAIAQIGGEARLAQAIRKVRSRLSAGDRATFNQVVTEFKAYQFAEVKRMTDISIDGTARGILGSEQGGVVRENFLKLLVETIQHQALKPVTPGAYRADDDQLKRAYRDDIHTMVTGWQEIMNDPQEKYWQDEYGWVIQDFEKTARKSQRHWIKLRDLLAELASSLYRDQAETFDPAISMKAAMTKNRIAELRTNR
ncbi:MAG: lysozyme inhibitor LprI family protein [Candidatus Binataceae bacterium]